MIDLKPAVGEFVFLQLKRPTYIVVKVGHGLLPMEQPAPEDPCRQDPTGRTPMTMPGVVVTVDYLIGELEECGSGYCVVYVEPGSRCRMRAMVDVDNVSVCFFESRVQVVKATEAVRPSA